MGRLRRFVIVCLLLTGYLDWADAQSLIDTLDGHPDLSEMMNSAYGVLPVAQPITEPALGIGVAGGLLYMHTKSSDMARAPGTPPDLSMVGGMYTANGSWAGALYHQNSLREDRIRVKGVVAYASINLTYYAEDDQDLAGASSDSSDGQNFNIEGLGFSPRAELRLFGTPFFLGLEYAFFANEVVFEDYDPVSDNLSVETRLAGLGATLRFNTLDNAFTPNRGLRAVGGYKHFDTFLGGTETYGLLIANGVGYLDPFGWLVLGLRLDGQWTFDEPPFYALPYVKLRGVPALRYQGKQVIVIETEERVNVSRRWSIVLFGGYGRPGLTTSRGNDYHEDVFAGGGGFRYLLARLTGLYAGVDVARGPQEWAFYITIGSAWSGF
ncbi:hypothetical protein ACFLRO_00340 [Bacteroidota bacterium]